MSYYPPEGCTYRVDRLTDDGRVSHHFDDEFALGEWLMARQRSGEFDPSQLKQPDDQEPNRFQIYCVADGEAVRISYFNPRLVRGRVEGHRERHD